MRNNSPFVLFIALLAIFSGCAPKMYVYKSPWQRFPVDVYDQRRYVPPGFFTDDKTKVNYSVSNDDEYLYIFIETNYEASVSGITQRGLQIWIDTTGRKNHQVGILCPLPQNPTGASGNHQRQRNWNSEDNQQSTSNYNESADSTRQNSIHRHFLQRTKQIHVSGFKTVADGLLTLPDTMGINMGVTWDNTNDLEYEVAISLKSFLKYPLSLSDSAKIIGLSFNFTSIPRGATNRGGGGSGFHPGFGMGMGGMGMMMMGGGGGGGVASPEPEAETIWNPFHLATKP